LCWPKSLEEQTAEKGLVRLDMYQRSTLVEIFDDSAWMGGSGDKALSVLRVLDHRMTFLK